MLSNKLVILTEENGQIYTNLRLFRDKTDNNPNSRLDEVRRGALHDARCPNVYFFGYF